MRTVNDFASGVVAGPIQTSDRTGINAGTAGCENGRDHTAAPSNGVGASHSTSSVFDMVARPAADSTTARPPPSIRTNPPGSATDRPPAGARVFVAGAVPAITTTERCTTFPLTPRAATRTV